MPIYTKKEFANACELTPGNLSNYIKRGKVKTKKAGKQIDTGESINAEFLAKRKVFLQSKKAEGKGVVTEIKEKEKPETQQVDPEIKQAALNKYEIDTLLKQVELEKKQEEVKKLKLQNAKIQGENIPFEEVKTIFVRNGQHIGSVWEQAIEKFLVLMKKELNLDDKKLARFRKNANNTVNEALKDLEKENIKDLKVIRDIHSVKRGKGERK